MCFVYFVVCLLFRFYVFCTAIRDNLRGLRKFSVGSSGLPSNRKGNHGGLPLQVRILIAPFAFFAAILLFGCGCAALGSLRPSEFSQPSPAIASFCALSSSLMPPSAISAMRSICFLVNGTLSAVPCTSINLPEPVMTKFMSTSAVLSST